MSAKAIFVTGTGTDVGKTFISAALAHGWAEAGKRVTYWKPVQSGLPSDLEMVRRLAGERVRYAPSSYVFELAASPDQAAAAESHPGIVLETLARETHSLLPSAGDLLIIEGAGGFLVPLNLHVETWADYLKLTGLPAIVVAHSGLGTLNHTALTVEALIRRQVEVLAIVLNGPAHEANRASMRAMLPDVEIVSFLQQPDPENRASWSESACALVRQLPI